MNPVPLIKKRLLDPNIHNSTLALVDQALVSGTNFLTTIWIGRICGAEELGIYTLGFTVVIFFNVILESLISTPFTIYVNRLSGDARRRYAGSVLIHCLGLCAAVMVLPGILGTWMFSGPDAGKLKTVFGVITAIGTFEILRQFARRFSFAEHRFASALRIDALVSVIQLGGLAALIYSHRISAVAAFWLLGLAGFLATAVWFLRNYHRFHISLNDIRPALQQNFELGWWIFGGRAVSAINNNMLHWILAFLLGTVSTGIFSACMTVVMFSNPLFLGASNILGPKAAHGFAGGGVAAVRLIVRKAVLYLSAGFFLFGLVLFARGEAILAFLYIGSEYLHKGNVINLLALHLLVSGISMAMYHGIVAIERPDINLKANIVALFTTLISALLLLPALGVLGAALSLLIGNIVSTFVQGVWFIQLTRLPAYRPQNCAPERAVN